jgi:hypothetical protein
MWFGIGIVVLEKPAASIVRIEHEAECGEMVWIRGRVDQSSLLSSASVCTIFPCSAYSYILKTETACAFRMLVCTQITWCHIPEDSS